MATAQNTAPDVGALNSYVPFSWLQARLLSQVHQVRLVDQRLWTEFAELPEEYQPAASVLHSAVESLDSLYDAFDQWSVRHHYTPRKPAPDASEASIPAIYARLTWMRETAEALRGEIEALHSTLPENVDTEGDSARGPLDELRVVLGEAARDATSVVNYLIPVPNQDANCPIYTLQHRVEGEQS